VHEHVLQRRHLIITLELRTESIVQGGIHVIKREIQGLFPVLWLTLHLARELRRHHMFRAARVSVKPRYRIRRVKVHVIIPRTRRHRRRSRRQCCTRVQNHRLLVLDFRAVRSFVVGNLIHLLLLFHCTLLVVYATQNPIIQLQKSGPLDCLLVSHQNHDQTRVKQSSLSI
jgi:hypothetical protein